MSAYLSRADLLKAFIANAKQPQLHQGLGGALGFEQRYSPQLNEAQADAKGDQESGTAEQAAQPAPKQGDVIYRPKREQRYWYVAACQTREASSENNLAWLEKKPNAYKRRALPRHELRSAGQWQNLWDTALCGRRRGRQVDMKRSLRLLERNQPVRDLPRQERSSFNRPVVLLLERSDALYPLWQDMRSAWLSLAKIIGKPLKVFGLASGPFNEWRCLNTGCTASYADVPPQSQVLLLGSFAESAQEGPVNIGEEWQQLLKQLSDDGHQTALISPNHLKQLPCTLHPLEPKTPKVSEPFASEILLSAIANHCLPDRKQLRHLRLAIPGAGVASELAVWQHEQLVEQDRKLQLKDDALSKWRKRWPELSSEALEYALDECRSSQSQETKEISQLQHALEKKPQVADFPALQVLGKKLAQLRKQGQYNQHQAVLVRSFLQTICELADSDPEPEWQLFLEEAQHIARYSNEPLPLKDQNLEGVAGEYYLYQQHQELRVSAENPEDPEDLPLLPLTKLNSQPYCKQTRNLLTTTAPKTHSELNLSDQSHRYHLKQLKRPAWSERIWRNSEGIFAQHSEGALFTLQEAAPQGPAESQWQLLESIENPWPWAEQTGVDKYGLWAEFKVGTRHGEAQQRLRWIPPGTFLMGSPVDEIDRQDNETQHQVTFSQGYWLADTACTQALWQVVMGKNPAHFTNDHRNPVEQVSWDDCQKFITKLNQFVPSLLLRLPTEAEWEYACRAGSTGPFNWGDELNTSRANYHGEYPCANGPKGEYRQTTLPVKAFEANTWGLHQMHGNVWEWCHDWYSEYASEPCKDPQGAKQGQYRVLRGGSWHYDGNYLRSASRYRLEPVVRFLDYGLRVAGGRDPQASQQDARRSSADRLARSAGRRGDSAAGKGSASQAQMASPAPVPESTKPKQENTTGVFHFIKKTLLKRDK